MFKRLRALSPGAVACVGTLIGLLLFILGPKVHKAVLLSERATDFFAATGIDFLFVGVASTLAYLVGLRRRGVLRTVLLSLLTTVCAAVAVLSMVEHGYFMATGSVPDGFVLNEFLSRFRERLDVMQSELTLTRAIGLTLPLFYFGALAPWLRGRVPGTDSRPCARPRNVYATLAAVFALGAAGSAIAATPRAAVLERNFALGLASDFLLILYGEDEPPRPPAEGPAEPRLELVGNGNDPRHNLIVILLESVSAKATSVAGPSEYNREGPPTTPFLHELAERGARVDRAYSVMPHTSKALVTTLCGVYPKLSSEVAEAAAGGIPENCLARLLSERGYATAFFQPAEENYELRSQLVREMGFEHFVGKESIHGGGFDESSYFGWEDNAMVAPITEWVRNQRGPFFLGVLTLATHHPYGVPRGFAKTQFVAKPELNDYLNTVAYSDAFLRRLSDSLSRVTDMTNTVVVVLGDHGEAFGEHRVNQHDTAVYEENVRIPMVLVGPGIEPGTVISGLRNQLDVVPTAVELLGFDLNRSALGRSVFASDGHESIYVHCYFRRRCRGILEGPYKFIDNYGRRPPELYNLETDPLERNDLHEESSADTSRFVEWVSGMDAIASRTNHRYDTQAEERRKRYITKRPPADMHRANVRFGAIEIVGASVSPQVSEAGSPVTITIDYHVLEEPDPDTRVFLHLKGPNRTVNKDHTPVEGTYPIAEWRVGEYIRDRTVVATRPDHPLGTYRVLSGLWTKRGGRMRPVDSSLPLHEETAVVLGSFEVRQRAIDTTHNVLTERPAIEHPLDITFGDYIRLLGVVIDKPRLRGGLKTTFTCTFETLRDLPEDLSFEIRFRGPSRKTRLLHTPVSGSYPLRQWRRGEFIIDPQAIITHTQDRKGRYDLELVLLRGRTPVRAEGTGLVVTSDGVITGSYRIE